MEANCGERIQAEQVINVHHCIVEGLTYMLSGL